MADTPRQILAEHFRVEHPAWDVRDWPDAPDRLGKGKVMLSIWRSDLRPDTTILGLEHELTIHVYSPRAVASAATEDELDTLLDEVMLSIERCSGARFGRATRRNFVEESFTGFEVELTMISGNHYRKTVQTERSTP